MASLSTADSITELTTGLHGRLACIARQPIPSNTKPEQEIANEDRRFSDQLDTVTIGT